MPKKILAYIDTETTGYDPKTNAMTEVAVIVVIDGEERGRLKLQINPYTYPRDVVIEDEALSFRGETKDRIREYPSALYQADEFLRFLDGFLEGKEKFQFAGYKTSFDIGFIKNWLEQFGFDYTDYFTHKDIDVFALVKHMRLWGLLDGCKNDKLGTVCEHFGVELDAHDAMNDIEATRRLYIELLNHLQYSISSGEVNLMESI